MEKLNREREATMAKDYIHLSLWPVLLVDSLICQMWLGSGWNTAGFLAVTADCGNHDNAGGLWGGPQCTEGVWTIMELGFQLILGKSQEVVAELLPDDMRPGVVHSSLQWESVMCVSVIGFLVGLLYLFRLMH